MGKESLEHLLRAYRDAFPNIRITVLGHLASGDTVVTRGRMNGADLFDARLFPSSIFLTKEGLGINSQSLTSNEC